MFNREQIFSLAWWTVSIGSSLPRVAAIVACRIFGKRVSETKTGTRVPLFQTFFPPAFSPNRAYISPVTIDKAAGADRMRLIKLMIYAQPRPNRACLFLLHFHVRSTETNCAQNRIYEPIDIHAAVCSLSQSISVPKNCFISWFRLTDLFAFTLFFFPVTYSSVLRIYLPETKRNRRLRCIGNIYKSIRILTRSLLEKKIMYTLTFFSIYS